MFNLQCLIFQDVGWGTGRLAVPDILTAERCLSEDGGRSQTKGLGDDQCRCRKITKADKLAKQALVEAGGGRCQMAVVHVMGTIRTIGGRLGHRLVPVKARDKHHRYEYR